VQRREVASVADMRGYRLYRRRVFGQARSWFLIAVEVDPSFELSLYNAARCSALLGEVRSARALLDRLRKLDTPLARARLEAAPSDPDLRGLLGPPDH
jgi:Flp pilus assembly protein TadD